MSKKKLYSFRADIKLLDALREKADKQSTTVSDVIHTILSRALDLPVESDHSRTVDTNNVDTEALIEEIKKEVTAQIKREVAAQVKKEIEENR